MLVLVLVLASGVRAAEGRLPTDREMDQASVELPFPFPEAQEIAGSGHIILFDFSGTNAFHEPLWARQAELLAEKLEKAGADPRAVRVVPVREERDLYRWIRGAGRKRVYVFGHAGPLTLLFGDDAVRVADLVSIFRNQGVESLCHYGCSFLAEDKAGLRAAQQKLKDGQSLTLFGHKRPSYKDDDSPWHPLNPVVGCRLGRCSAEESGAFQELGTRALDAAARLAGRR